MENRKEWLIKGTKEFILMMVFFTTIVVVLGVSSYSATLVGLHPTIGLLVIMILGLYGMSLQNAYTEEQVKRKQSE
tara:strand:+ start:236 stop:463 length:228 start_codon:yes stop_codon:yes gene_type:complete